MSDLTPEVESSKRWARACQIEDSPRALLEAGIAELFGVHKAVLTATKDEQIRGLILPAIHEKFADSFRAVALQAKLEHELPELVRRRLATYGSLMDQSLPNWHHRLGEQVYECIAGRRPEESPLFAVAGMLMLTVMTETTKFLRKVL